MELDTTLGAHLGIVCRPGMASASPIGNNEVQPGAAPVSCGESSNKRSQNVPADCVLMCIRTHKKPSRENVRENFANFSKFSQVLSSFF